MLMIIIIFLALVGVWAIFGDKEEKVKEVVEEVNKPFNQAFAPVIDHGLSEEEVKSINIDSELPHSGDFKTSDGLIEGYWENGVIKWIRYNNSRRYNSIAKLLKIEVVREPTREKLLDMESRLERVRRFYGLENGDTDDATEKQQKQTILDIEAELEGIIGQDTIKKFIRSLHAQLRMQKEREKLGLKVNPQTLHMIFKGNPGTGKTTIARIVARLLHDMGVISTNKMIETDRAGLVGEYLGHTAIKVDNVFERAIDGVLFIDEAYALYNGIHDDFGKEAIDALVKRMEDSRDKIIVILAGYSGEMDSFLEVNTGLSSRFPTVIEFPDYSVEELIEISKQLAAVNDYQFTDKAIKAMVRIFAEECRKPNFGNGRFVRNLFEKSVRQQAVRMNTTANRTKEIMSSIDEQDIV